MSAEGQKTNIMLTLHVTFERVVWKVETVRSRNNFTAAASWIFNGNESEAMWDRYHLLGGLFCYLCVLGLFC